MHLPPHPIVAGTLAHYSIVLLQLAPNGWRVLVAFAVLCHFRGAGAPLLPVFHHFFALAPLPKAKGWYPFRSRESVLAQSGPLVASLSRCFHQIPTDDEFLMRLELVAELEWHKAAIFKTNHMILLQAVTC
ncbi:hypothetical protein C2845_PM10G13790 [Panicum miliaceum]|uniref:Transposase (putative) gypsy type domain-containing protein n=1 Tax=Panicum miliaceum TaxID=4540 RepID=A0A3L6PBY2_PANMI|nr:hypothetical protein C2845_PM10G13790 [Panicum miliaceum]